jgi:hypothetical protein
MRGQYFSFDAIIASVIFVLALVALLSYWNSMKSFLDYQNDQLSRDAVRVSNLLFTPPSPTSSCGTMKRLGLSMAWDDKRVDERVLSCAKGQNQAWLREKLGTAYNVSIEVTNLGTNKNTTIGGSVPSNAKNVVNMRRLATVYNSTSKKDYLASIDLSLYR